MNLAVTLRLPMNNYVRHDLGLDAKNPGLEVIKHFLMLNSTEHEIYPAHKC